jgi:quinol monooxygenase YgiN
MQHVDKEEVEMYAQVITYHLKDLSQEDYAKICASLAPSIAQQPGLIAKVWLADPATNTYGGAYTWHDRAAMEAFMETDLVKSFAAHPSIVGLTSRDYAVMEEPTRVTRGFEAVVAS